MKQYIHTFPLVVFVLLCAGCTQADIVAPEPGGGKTEEGVPLSIKSLGMTVEVESRSIVTGGPEEVGQNPNPLTAVGVSVTKTSSSGTVSFYNSSVRNQQFVYKTEAAPPAWQLDESAERLVLYTEKGTVYGYAPAEKSVSLAGTPKVPLISSVRVMDKQTFSFYDAATPVAATDVQWETDQDDYLYGKATAEVDRWNPEASLEMHHALAKVSFRVLEAGGGTAFDGCMVAKVVLKSSGGGFKKSTAAKLNLSTGELSGTMYDVGELWFTAGGDLRAVGSGVSEASAVPVQAFGLVMPVSGVAATLELTFDDGRVFNMSPAADGSTPGTFTVNWEKGNNYIYNLRLQPQGIELANITVAGWNEGGAHDVPME